MILSKIKAVGLFALVSSFIACGSEASLEIKGSWKSNYDALETIDETTWSSTTSGVTSTYTIVKFDNENNMAITQNAADATYDPGKFNKIVWTDLADDSFYYCMVDYSKESAEEAEASTTTADSNDPATTGCGGFAWTQLSAHSEYV